MQSARIDTFVDRCGFFVAEKEATAINRESFLIK
jgi:hypothetical protein